MAITTATLLPLLTSFERLTEADILQLRTLVQSQPVPALNVRQKRHGVCWVPVRPARDSARRTPAQEPNF